jgi:VIT1/CCC1 family predicted Fe2+/Mn2+ transporter
LGDELAQLHQLADVIKARLHRAQEETEQDTQALKQVQGVIVEQCRVVEQEKVSLQEKFEEEKAQMQQEKEQLLTKKLEVKEAFNKALRSVTGLEPQVEEQVTHQVEQLT